MNKLAAVFWDVDGTIADTELCGHRVAFNLAFKDFGLDWIWDEKKYIDLLKISGGLNRIIHFRDEIHSNLSDNFCSELQSKKRSYYKGLIESGTIKPRDGVLMLIKELGDLNIDQFIVTTSGRESLEPLLRTSLNSYLKYFSKTITYEDVRKHKPYPDAYKLAIKLSNQSPSNCISIEDSRIGVMSAKAANVKCLLTLPPWTNTFNNIYLKADACVDSLGNMSKESKLIYGKPLMSKTVDFSYLTTIIN